MRSRHAHRRAELPARRPLVGARPADDRREPAWATAPSVLDLPAAAAGNGIHQLHLCHFHVADRDPVWLSEFRAACTDAGVTLSMLLIDDGDLTDPVHHARDRAWIAGWIETAAVLGASSARVVAGKRKPSPEAITPLAGLTARFTGRVAGVAIVTESWHDLLAGPRRVDRARCRQRRPRRPATPATGMARRSTSARPHSAPRRRRACQGLVRRRRHGYGRLRPLHRCRDCRRLRRSGTLIYDGPDADEWANIAIERRFVLDRLAMAAPERRTA